MALQTLLRDTVAIQRLQTTKGLSGAPVRSWADLAGFTALSALVQAQRVWFEEVGSQGYWVSGQRVYFGDDVPLMRGDRLVWLSSERGGSVYLRVLGYRDQGGQRHVYAADCVEFRE